jgi:NAD(P)-dependent dehydrogenase (short-subunit alcohol dehydrogenase family)
VAFLVSADASYVNGQRIGVNGGGEFAQLLRGDRG